jgi:steroid 5-alpha reductase family enzyme
MFLFFFGLSVVSILMLLCWFYAVKIDNFGIVDALWSYSFFIHAVIFLLVSGNLSIKNIIFASMIGLWSLRLGTFLTLRIASHHPVEDTRYQGLRSEYGKYYKMRFLLFFFYQALSVSLLTLPFLFVFQNTNQSIGAWETLGALLWLLALLGESLADKQMSHFKKLSKIHPEMGRTCNIGLWKYSRHPNYFFESLIWWGFAFFSFGAGHFWGAYNALIILFLLVKVTGIPPSEAQSLKSRGEEYKKYQEVTSAFIPWFPKN